MLSSARVATGTTAPVYDDAVSDVQDELLDAIDEYDEAADIQRSRE